MNRVLFKAAAIVNIAAAALIYVACSGDDGKDGPPGPAGANCTVAESTTVPGGIDVICGSDRKTLGPGPAGAPGAPGQNGQGVPADGCYLSSVAGGYNVICGGVDQGALTTGGGGAGGGCNISTAQGSPYYTFTCGSTVYELAKAICSYTDNGVDKSQPYDPAFEVCNSTGGVKGNCGGEAINLRRQFCSTSDLTGKDTLTVLARCGVKYVFDELGTDTLSIKPDSTGEYNPKTQFCMSNTQGTIITNTGTTGTNALRGTTPIEGSARDFCDPASNNGKYTVKDFCFGAEGNKKVYAMCTSPITSSEASYNPTTQFCQVSGTTGSYPAIGGAASTDLIRPRCGTGLQGYTSGNLGSGAYNSSYFCSPLVSKIAAGANAKRLQKCVGGNKGTGTPGASDPATAGDIYGIGEYNVTEKYCQTEVSAWTSAVVYSWKGLLVEYTATKEGVPNHAVCGSVKFDPNSSFCAASIVYPVCDDGSGTMIGTDGVDAAEDESVDYNVSKRYCDTRGQIYDPANATTTTIGDVITITGGKLYTYVTLGGKNWTVEDLKLEDGTNITGNSALDNAEKFTWIQAGTVCPEGWHLSTDAEWTALDAAATAAATPGSGAGLDLRGTGWSNASTSTTYNAFKALEKAVPTVLTSTNAADVLKLIAVTDGTVPAGTSPVLGTHKGPTKVNIWWTSAEVDANTAKTRYIKDSEVTLGSDTYNKLASQFSVRCVKD